MSIAMTNKTNRKNSGQLMPVPVQILSTLLFGAFGILAIIFAFDASWIAGLIVAVILGWRGGFAPSAMRLQGEVPTFETIVSLAPEARNRTSGNASFDAYRADTLRRLQEEQDKFERFLGRLREAKDQSEFDDFLNERAHRNASPKTMDYKSEKASKATINHQNL